MYIFHPLTPNDDRWKPSIMRAILETILMIVTINFSRIIHKVLTFLWIVQYHLRGLWSLLNSYNHLEKNHNPKTTTLGNAFSWKSLTNTFQIEKLQFMTPRYVLSSLKESTSNFEVSQPKQSCVQILFVIHQTIDFKSWIYLYFKIKSINSSLIEVHQTIYWQAKLIWLYFLIFFCFFTRQGKLFSNWFDYISNLGRTTVWWASSRALHQSLSDVLHYFQKKTITIH